MAFRILKRYPRSILRGTKEVEQKFNYLLVMDFEATCQKNEILSPQEIIEFPCVVLSTKDWKVKNVFHEYVKPKVHPELTLFCTELTGIIQDMVESQPYFPEIFHKFSMWLEEHKYFTHENASAFVTCGDWDLKVMLPNQCNIYGITLPDHFKQWINLKNTFCDATNYYPRSLRDMLTRMNIPMQGQLHSGINDVQNMVKIMKTLHANHNAVFRITTGLDKQ